jgi:hypothetical protein
VCKRKFGCATRSLVCATQIFAVQQDSLLVQQSLYAVQLGSSLCNAVTCVAIVILNAANVKFDGADAIIYADYAILNGADTIFGRAGLIRLGSL